MPQIRGSSQVMSTVVFSFSSVRRLTKLLLPHLFASLLFALSFFLLLSCLVVHIIHRLGAAAVVKVVCYPYIQRHRKGVHERAYFFKTYST
mmetsp:Transcript_16057/g.35739  ORF Transcript_16057/g.35739 Transcript_16057/m.35739 type:complete len:91 (-) Transcript_16057:7-279(-)